MPLVSLAVKMQNGMASQLHENEALVRQDCFVLAGHVYSKYNTPGYQARPLNQIAVYSKMHQH